MVTNTTTNPVQETVCLTLAQAKKQLNIELAFTEQDDLIQDYIDTSRVIVENYINRSISQQKLVLECSDLSKIVFSQNNENDTIDKIEYLKAGESVYTLMPVDDYKLRKGVTVETKEITFLTTPELEKKDDAVIVTINQGWVTADVPKPLIQAMKLYVSDMYERREDRGEVGYNSAATALMRPYRKY
jgi:Phage gp6-like head-tail connector protein